jgi:hypothetical protein
MVLGRLVKELTDQTLIVIDYSNLAPPITIHSWTFSVDVSSNPELVASYPQMDSVGKVLTFLLSGGIVGQQYNLKVTLATTTGARDDTLTINIPSSKGDCVSINPVPSIYNQIPLNSQGWVNTGIRYFWGPAPPHNPGVLDQWYNPDNQVLYEWATDGTNYFWEALTSVDEVLEAPMDGFIYGRSNGFWVKEPIQADAPADGKSYSRSNNTWLYNPLSSDAPSDGKTYGRSNAAWVVVTSGGGGGGTVDPVAPVGGPAINADQVNVGDTATLICAALPGGRVNITLQNNGFDTVALGNPGLTFTTGSWRLQAGEAITLQTTAAIYGICSGGITAVVDFIEVIAAPQPSNSVVGAAAINADQINIGSGPTLICAARVGAIGVGRVNVTLQNNGDVTVAIGAADLLFGDTSWRLQPGEAITLPTTAALYGVCDVGSTSVVDFIEVF